MEENFTPVVSNEVTSVTNFDESYYAGKDNFSFDKLASYLIRFLNQLKKTGRSVNTINAYRNDLSLFCEFLVEKQIRPDHYASPVQDYWIQFLKKNGRRSQASIRRAQMSVRSFLHYLVADGVIDKSAFLETRSPKQPSNQLLTVSHEKYLQLCKALKSKVEMSGDAKSSRDLVLVQILGECGLKASEASNLCWGDIWPELDSSGNDSIVGCLRVKGENERLIPFSQDLSYALELLKEARKKLELSVALDAKLFFGYLNVSRRTRTDFLHRHGIKFVIYEVCNEFLSVPYNSESLRNHAILRWISQGLDNEKVAHLAGYSSLNSLERFLRCSDVKKLGKKKKKRTLVS